MFIKLTTLVDQLKKIFMIKFWNRFFILFFLFLIFLNHCSFPEKKNAPRNPPILLNRSRPLPVIRLVDNQDHRFIFTNKIAGFFVGHTHDYNQNAFEGWTVNETHLIKDYKLFKNGRELKRNRLKAFILHPYGFERIYPDKTVENFVLLDSIDAIFLKIKANKRDRITLQLPDFKAELNEQKSSLFLKNKKFGNKGLKIDYFNGQNDWHYFVFRFGQFFTEDSLTLNEIERFEKAVTKRKQRFAQLLQKNPFFIENRNMREALQWAIFSTDALVTRQKGPGIWAGLPWFNSYWGRDTFISFTGALLVRGEFEAARNILNNFAHFQLTDENRRELGRIPNRITNNEIIYNTADGTWWFLRAIYQYYLFTGDKAFLKEMFPVIQRAINGALKKRMDAFGFLTHGDAESWMDAVGAKGAWTPRGNRAVEIQALWYTALQIGVKSAVVLNRVDEEIKKWQSFAKRIKTNFNRFFWNDLQQALYDHLNEDGTPDLQLRPNQILAITVPDLPGLKPLLPDWKQKAIARWVTENLTTDYGVLSLWFKDKNFHPFHHYLPYYSPDAAYHNGLIWGWLAGPVISSQLKFDQVQAGSKLFFNEAQQILNFDALGSFSEILEPVVRKGQDVPSVSGTIAQAWSLAEFLRNFYENWLGYNPMAGQDQVFFKPHLMDGIEEIRARLPFKNRFLDVHLQNTATGMKIRVCSNFPKQTIRGFVQFPGDSLKIRLFLPDSGRDFEYEYIAIDTLPDSVKLARQWRLAKIDSSIKFATIYQIPFKLLKAEQVYFPLGRNGLTLIHKKDILNDDFGANGRYTYPLNRLFESGIADIKSLTIYDNDSTWGFRIDLRNLIDPGWHPEYGFQLTFLAIAIQDPTLDGTLARKVGHQAHLTLPASRKFNRIIYVGGGLEVCDGNDQRKALFVPLDQKHPLGNPSLLQIRFQIPKVLLPGLNAKSKITILCGLQDDHGGAGLGDFRAVLPKADYWHGGGAAGHNGPAVYDVLEIN